MHKRLTIKYHLCISGALLGALSSVILPSQATAMPISPPTTMQNHTINYGLMSFTTSASRKVANDQINASLAKTVQHKSSTDAQNQIATTLNQAMAIARNYPQVQVSSGNQTTYPQYDKNQKIIGWTGKATLNLKSTDIIATSKLIADLQALMTMENLDFSVSDAKRKEVEQALMIDVSRNFQQQAAALLPAWGAQSYQLVNVEFQQGNDYYPRSRAMPMMATVKLESNAVADQDFQAGETNITVNAHGTVQLIR